MTILNLSTIKSLCWVRPVVFCFVFALVFACGQQSSVAPESGTKHSQKDVEAYPSSYYRVRATFRNRETLNEVAFDYVAGCGGVVSRWKFTQPAVWRTWHPRLMVTATGDGAAIGIRTPNMCEPDSWGYVDYDGRVVSDDETIPVDFLPFAIWFPDVSNLGWGIGYASDFAYESRLAKMEFVEASLERASREDWLDWREASQSQYRQVGGIPGPWGWQGVGAGATQEDLERSKTLNGDRHYISANTCNGAIRIPLPEGAQSQIDALIPNDEADLITRYLHPGPWDEVRAILQSYEGAYFGGDFRDHTSAGGDELGVRRSSGGGRVTYRGSDWRYYNDRFPVLLNQALSEHTASNSAVIFEHPDWLGFLFCGLDVPTFDNLKDYTIDPTQKLNLDVPRAHTEIQREQSVGVAIWDGTELEDTGSSDPVPNANTLIRRDKNVITTCCSIAG